MLYCILLAGSKTTTVAIDAFHSDNNIAANGLHSTFRVIRLSPLLHTIPGHYGKCVVLANATVIMANDWHPTAMVLLANADGQFGKRYGPFGKRYGPFGKRYVIMY